MNLRNDLFNWFSPQITFNLTKSRLTTMVASTANFLAALDECKFAGKNQLHVLVNQFKQSNLYENLRQTYHNTPSTMQLPEIMCYAIGRATDADALDTTLNELCHHNPHIKTSLTDQKHIVIIIELLPELYKASFYRFYKKCDINSQLQQKITDDFQALRPAEFHEVIARAEQNLTMPSFTFELVQYLLNPQKMFELICYIPQSDLLNLVSHAQFSTSQTMPSWLKHPKSDVEILIAYLIEKDINKIDAEKLRTAIDNVAAQYPDDTKVNDCLLGFRITLAAIDPLISNAQRWPLIKGLAANKKLFINLSGARVEGADLSGTNLEYALFAPLDKLYSTNTEQEIMLRDANLRGTRLPLTFCISKVNLFGAQLEGSTIHQFQFFNKNFILDSSLFSDLTAQNVTATLTDINIKINQQAKIAEARNTIATLLVSKLATMQDKVQAEHICDAALAHPMFAHRDKLPNAIDAVGRLFTHHIFYSTDSQDILLEFKKSLLSGRELVPAVSH